MDSESESEDEMDTQDIMEHGYAVGGQFDYKEDEEIQTYTRGEFDEPPVLSSPHTLDVPSVRGPPPSVTTSADSVFAHGRQLPPLGNGRSRVISQWYQKCRVGYKCRMRERKETYVWKEKDRGND